MSTMQPIVVAQMPSRRAVVATLLVVAFSMGMIVGALAVRALDGSLPAAVRPAPAALVPFQGVSDNNMSDAARGALYAPGWFRGVADRNMSDAARSAARAAGWFRGVPPQNMSEAARAARLPGWFRGVAENNMSDAANRDSLGRDR
jgi:hypothetical protein